MGSIQSNEKTVKLILGSKGVDAYSASYNRPLKEANIWYSWNKQPIFTQSLRYPGSLLPSKGYIYRSKYSIGKDANIVVSHPDVVLNLCYIDVVNSNNVSQNLPYLCGHLEKPYAYR